MIPEILTRERMRTPQSVFGSSSLGSIGDPPVPSGDPPDGTGVTVQANDGGLFTRLAFAWPLRRIQPLEYLEHFLLMFRRDANAVVLHRVVRLIVFHTAGHGMGKMPKRFFLPSMRPIAAARPAMITKHPGG